ncbi:GtrA family protein [Rufibacter roseus]|uniref:GtrA family protein n=1 Tax=Rufibacter roseus TaxID=1567108 RepID=A0ABW2DQW4_9BACT|nr:GtrA family protein [Rufibacter roseus]
MLTFVKAQTASIVATLVDFLVTVLAVEWLELWYVSGTVWGTISGGITHFSLGRNWVFQSEDPRVIGQVIKYFIVWTGSFLLNALGVFLITHYLGISYVYSKVATSIMVGVGYNYVFQKRFVFK